MRVGTRPTADAGRCPRSGRRPRRREAGAGASIEEARIIVAGGRGVGGPDGFKLVEELAEALGGAVGATRAAVDSGWIPYSQQIGQTGKIVKPRCTSRSASAARSSTRSACRPPATIVAVNRDPDAPIAEFADMIVIGDLFEVGPALAGRAAGRGGLSAAGERCRACGCVLLPILAFVALAAVFVVVLRRAGRIAGADPRGRSGSGAAVEDLAGADRRVAGRGHRAGSTPSAPPARRRRRSGRHADRRHATR